MHVNEDHVERIEGGATSAVFLINGTYLIVRDDVDTISDRIRSEKVSLLTQAICGSRFDGARPALGTVVSSGEARRDAQP